MSSRAPYCQAVTVYLSDKMAALRNSLPGLRAILSCMLIFLMPVMVLLSRK